MKSHYCLCKGKKIVAKKTTGVPLTLGSDYTKNCLVFPSVVHFKILYEIPRIPLLQPESVFSWLLTQKPPRTTSFVTAVVRRQRRPSTQGQLFCLPVQSASLSFHALQTTRCVFVHVHADKHSRTGSEAQCRPVSRAGRPLLAGI